MYTPMLPLVTEIYINTFLIGWIQLSHRVHNVHSVNKRLFHEQSYISSEYMSISIQIYFSCSEY